MGVILVALSLAVNGALYYRDVPGLVAALGAAMALVGLGLLTLRVEALLVACSLATGVLVAEGALQALDLPPTMPAAWRMVPVERPAWAEGAMRWHGHVHAMTRDHFRAPPVPADVVALGDSFTYGWGVAESEAWPALIGATNLGIPSAQSEQIATAARRWLPVLHPRVVVYGVCPNDLLPEGPPVVRSLPWWTAQTRPGLLAGVAWRSAGESFYAEIARRGDPRRWTRDLVAIRAAAAGVGARLVVVVLEVHPEFPEAQALARTLVDAGRSVGVEVVVPAHAGGSVSRWEGHPSAATHRAYAAAIRRAMDAEDEVTSAQR